MVLTAALIGGVIFKLIKFQALIGFILAGIVFGQITPVGKNEIEKLAEIGIILLLFSVGIELSFSRLARVFRVATFGALIQVAGVSLLLWLILRLFGIGPLEGLIMAFGFSLSSTAVVVKILSERGETETIHGEIMLGWLIMQDLLVIPAIALLPVIASGGGSFILPAGLAILKVIALVIGVIFFGRILVPYVFHKVSALNSRELLVILAISFALGVAIITEYLGLSTALGAFLAGIVISEIQENHAVFAETRPLRDLFVALFFVTLGFLVVPSVMIQHFGLIVAISCLVILIKALVLAALSLVFGYRGRSTIAISLGLSQVGEFSFVLFSLALGLGILSPTLTSIGIGVTLFTLIVTPVLFKSINPVYRKVRDFKIFTGKPRVMNIKNEVLSGHIIICGFGRVGKWVGKVLSEYEIPYLVIEYNSELARKLEREGVRVIYGDPSQIEVLESANLKEAKACVLAIPDQVAQEEIIGHVQTMAPKVKIISRVHLDEDWEKLKFLKVDKMVQPEFEAAIAITKGILTSMGKPKEEISERIKKLRLSRAMT